MIDSEEQLPDDPQSLKSLVLDLSRRLQNAQHTIEAERKATLIAQKQVEYFRTRLTEISHSFKIETASFRNTENKAFRTIESKKFEDTKVLAAKLLEELRMAELDHQMTGMKSIPTKLQRLRNKVKQIDSQQQSQKILIGHLNEIDQMNEKLILTCQSGEKEYCLQLVLSGADVNYIDAAGYLPLHYACVYGYYDIVQILLENGSDHTDKLTGYSPLVLASKNGHVNIIKLLVDYGANIEEKGISGIPAIIAALEGGHFSTVEYLLQLGADINSQNSEENTPLHLATRVKPDPTLIISYLINMGADIHKINKHHWSPLQLALREKNTLAINILNGMDNNEEFNRENDENESKIKETNSFKKSLDFPPKQTSSSQSSPIKNNQHTTKFRNKLNKVIETTKLTSLDREQHSNAHSEKQSISDGNIAGNNLASFSIASSITFD